MIRLRVMAADHRTAKRVLTAMGSSVLIDDFNEDLTGYVIFATEVEDQDSLIANLRRRCRHSFSLDKTDPPRLSIAGGGMGS